MAYQRKKFKPIVCAFCGTLFTPIVSNQKFCSEKCGCDYRAKKYRENKLPEKKEKSKCLSCSKIFEKNQKSQKFCSAKCRAKYFGSGSPFVGKLPSGTVGTMTELLVCVDLLKKGYEVFRAISPCCSCDIAILKDGELRRVEVRTANRWMLTHPEEYVKRLKVDTDILAMIDFKKDKIVYYPEKFDNG